MLNRREILTRNCKADLDFIVRMMDPQTAKVMYPGKDIRDVVVDQLIAGLSRGGRGKKDTIREGFSLRETTHYKLAQILNTDYIKTWEDFVAETKRKFADLGYLKNPRNLLQLGNLPWFIPFEIPPKKFMKSRKNGHNRIKAAPAPGVRKLEPSAETKIELKEIEKELSDIAEKESFERAGLRAYGERLSILEAQIGLLVDFVLMESLGDQKLNLIKRLYSIR